MATSPSENASEVPTNLRQWPAVVNAWRCFEARIRLPATGYRPTRNKTMDYLFKEEPANYPFDALVKDGKTIWSGVKNPLAQKHLRSVKKGDRIFYYHTGDEKAVVGIAKALMDAYPDRKDKTGRAFVVDIAPVKKLSRPVTLAEIKSKVSFRDFPLVRISRLSVMPVSDREWKEIERMAGS
jgi:predicted RNA-binding protein with PUA-like domain